MCYISLSISSFQWVKSFTCWSSINLLNYWQIHTKTGQPLPDKLVLSPMPLLGSFGRYISATDFFSFATHEFKARNYPDIVCTPTFSNLCLHASVGWLNWWPSRASFGYTWAHQESSHHFGDEVYAWENACFRKATAWWIDCWGKWWKLATTTSSAGSSTTNFISLSVIFVSGFHETCCEEFYEYYAWGNTSPPELCRRQSWKTTLCLRHVPSYLIFPSFFYRIP